MPTYFITEDNKELLNKEVYIDPERVKNATKTILSAPNSTTNKGYKRLMGMINPEYNGNSNYRKDDQGGVFTSFNNLKRIMHDVQNARKHGSTSDHPQQSLDVTDIVQRIRQNNKTAVKPVQQPKPPKAPSQPKAKNPTKV